jgi:hypothetical protein
MSMAAAPRAYCAMRSGSSVIHFRHRERERSDPDFPFVIPGRIENASLKSISPDIRGVPWIPGLRLTPHPGMTRCWMASSRCSSP